MALEGQGAQDLLEVEILFFPKNSKFVWAPKGLFAPWRMDGAKRGAEGQLPANPPASTSTSTSTPPQQHEAEWTEEIDDLGTPAWRTHARLGGGQGTRRLGQFAQGKPSNSLTSSSCMTPALSLSQVGRQLAEQAPSSRRPPGSSAGAGRRAAGQGRGGGEG